MAEESKSTHGGRPNPQPELVGFDDWFHALPRDHNRNKIQRVPGILRNIESNKGCFEPLVISIGPYHRRNQKLEHMQPFKVLGARKYAENQSNGMGPSFLYERIKKVAGEARKCYPEDATEGMSESEFTRMMFLDTCFFLQFISGGVEGMSDADKVYVGRDLLLLENQLPFMLVKALVGVGNTDNDLVAMMTHFIEKQWRTPPTKKKCTNWHWKNEYPPTHLLHLLREYLLTPDCHQLNMEYHSNPCAEADNWHTYRSAKELKKLGIDFGASETHNFSDVRFSRKPLLGIRGKLNLPPILIDDYTVSILLNLAAYEMSEHLTDGIPNVTSYICFLNELIDHVDDVVELRSKGILGNAIGSDEQVAKLFNTIATSLTWDPRAYKRVVEQIESHCRNKPKIWVLERLYIHFEAPWSRISFIAALAALVLSFIQTYFTVVGVHRLS